MSGTLTSMLLLSVFENSCLGFFCSPVGIQCILQGRWPPENRASSNTSPSQLNALWAVGKDEKVLEVQWYLSLCKQS